MPETESEGGGGNTDIIVSSVVTFGIVLIVVVRLYQLYRDDQPLPFMLVVSLFVATVILVYILYSGYFSGGD